MADPPDWLLPAAAALFDRAVLDGWAVDGADGFVYTTDWDGNPVVRDRMHWVVAEGIAAAAALPTRTGDDRYADLAATWWAYAERYLFDRTYGSWHHQLDASNQVIDTVWPGADLYHAVQATVIPRLPLAPSLATAARGGSVERLCAIDDCMLGVNAAPSPRPQPALPRRADPAPPSAGRPQPEGWRSPEGSKPGPPRATTAAD